MLAHPHLLLVFVFLTVCRAQHNCNTPADAARDNTIDPRLEAGQATAAAAAAVSSSPSSGHDRDREHEVAVAAAVASEELSAMKRLCGELGRRLVRGDEDLADARRRLAGAQAVAMAVPVVMARVTALEHELVRD